MTDHDDDRRVGLVPWTPIAVVPADTVSFGDSPRLTGIDKRHVEVLAEFDGVLPPILVHRPTMRVIDGSHRLRARRLRGEDHIEVEFFDGSEADAFILAVRANTTHGLPLTLSDRRAAATRILKILPAWSDAAVAEAAGLGARTVRRIRDKLEKTNGQTHGLTRIDRRVGRDGRVRPLDSTGGRLAAREFMTTQPHASLRDIARAAGVSVATARDVRDRVQRGEDPVPRGRHSGDGATVDRYGAESAGGRACAAKAPRDARVILDGLRRDPALRTDAGRVTLRWLLPQVLGTSQWHEIIRDVPAHCTYPMAELARSCADEWLEFASELQSRAQHQRGEPFNDVQCRG